MSAFTFGTLAVSLILAGTTLAQTLHVYGPGGPLAPIKECAAIFKPRWPR